MSSLTVFRLFAAPDVADKEAVQPKKAPAGLLADFERRGQKGRMSLEALMKTGEIEELLTDKLLAKSELEGFWAQVSEWWTQEKCNHLVTTLASLVSGRPHGWPSSHERGSPVTPIQVAGPLETVDLEGYLQIHALVDTLFEEDEEQEAMVVDKEAQPALSAPAGPSEAALAKAEVAFAELSLGGKVTLQAFLESGDVLGYVQEGLVTREEVEGLWQAQAQAAGVQASDALGWEAFLKVVAEVEGLFEEEEGEEDGQEVEEGGAQSLQAGLVTGGKDEEDEDAVEFRRMAGPDGRLTFESFLKTSDLPDLVSKSAVQSTALTLHLQRFSPSYPPSSCPAP